jgi:colanic acid/amylovoran biosynthesis glycosyltransferase
MIRVGYFINQYPAATHTFIRREIRAMEALGVSTVRYALRPGEHRLVDPEDEIEKNLTEYVLKSSIVSILRCFLVAAVTQPLALARAVREALNLGWRSDRGLWRHMSYVVEAVVLASWCRRDDIQHLHAHFGTNSASIAMLSRHFSGIPYSFTIHGPEEFEKAELLSLDTKVETCAFVVCISSFGRSQLMRWTPPNQWYKIEVIHCGVDSTFLSGPVAPISDAARLVCVGRLDAPKGQTVLVRAAKRLHDIGIPCDIVLVGDGPLRSHTEEVIRRAGLQNSIRLIGWASGTRVKEEMLAARAIVVPSFAEGLPVVIMEAMSLGRPVIATYVAGIPELVENGKTGWLVPAGNDIVLSEAMRAALDASVDELTLMGKAARRRVTERHDSLREAEKLKKLVEKPIEFEIKSNPTIPWSRPFVMDSSECRETIR